MENAPVSSINISDLVAPSSRFCGESLQSRTRQIDALPEPLLQCNRFAAIADTDCCNATGQILYAFDTFMIKASALKRTVNRILIKKAGDLVKGEASRFVLCFVHRV